MPPSSMSLPSLTLTGRVTTGIEAEQGGAILGVAVDAVHAVVDGLSGVDVGAHEVEFHGIDSNVAESKMSSSRGRVW